MRETRLAATDSRYGRKSSSLNASQFRSGADVVARLVDFVFI